MADIHVPLSSTVAGALSDGGLDGSSINESLHHRILTNVQLASNRYLLFMDFDKGAFYDLSSTIASGVKPWGGSSGVGIMSQGDGYLVACDTDVTEIGLEISVSGVGTWSTMQIFDSTNGTTFNREITGFTDNTTAMKAATGWKNIVLPANSETGRVAISPSPVLNIASRKWVLVKPAGTFTVTTAPTITGLYLRHPQADERWLDITGSSNDSLTVQPAVQQSFHPTVGSMVVYFFDGLPVGWERYIWTAQSNVRTRVVKYAANAAGTTFTNLANVVDPSADFTDTPNAPLPEKYSVRWTPPSDAVRVSRSFTLADNSVVTVTDKYMLIIETTAISSIAPMTPTSARVRAKMLGSAGTSGTAVTAHTVKRVTMKRRGVATGSGSIAYQLYNFTQEKSVSFTLPDTDALAPVNLDIADIAFADGDIRGLYHASGSRTVQDLDIDLHS